MREPQTTYIWGLYTASSKTNLNRRYNTDQALHLLPRALVSDGTDPAPVVATFLMGSNDAALPDGKGAAQHVPVARYRENLRGIVKGMREAGDAGGQGLGLGLPMFGFGSGLNPKP